jgi:hypothetical protein
MSTKLPPDFGKIPTSRVPFGDRLSGLCAMELAAAHGDPKRIGEMIERLLNSLAFTLAMSSKGRPSDMDEMIEGATSYLYETASGHARVAAALSPPQDASTLRGDKS